MPFSIPPTGIERSHGKQSKVKCVCAKTSLEKPFAMPCPVRVICGDKNQYNLLLRLPGIAKSNKHLSMCNLSSHYLRFPWKARLPLKYSLRHISLRRDESWQSLPCLTPPPMLLTLLTSATHTLPSTKLLRYRYPCGRLCRCCLVRWAGRGPTSHRLLWMTMRFQYTCPLGWVR